MYNITAIDIRDYVLIPQIFETCREVFHGDFVLTANINSPKQQDISHVL